MRLLTYSASGKPRLGALVQGHVVDLVEAFAIQGRRSSPRVQVASLRILPSSLLGLLQGGENALRTAEETAGFAAEDLTELEQQRAAFPEATVTFLPPIPSPGKIICVGRNYGRHLEEMKKDKSDYPVLFAKFSNTLVGHRQPIVLPTVSNMVDYEGELAVIIGKEGKDIPPEHAFDHVAGYSIFNDLSVRDYQYRTPQWLQGKTFDGMGPIGPCLVTADEVKNPPALDLTLRLNGEVMQSGNTSDFIFDIPTLIHYLSQILTLEPGDMIATGTPGGVGYARSPQVFLKPGDRVQVEIGGLGVLENPVVAAA